MFAAVLMLVGIVGMIQAVTIGSQMLDLSRKQMVAQQVIQNEIDRLRLGTWSQVSGMAVGTYTISVSQSGTVSGDLTRFALTNYSTSTTDDQTALITVLKTLASVNQAVTCSIAVSDLGSNFRRIRYTITWTGAGTMRSTTAANWQNALGWQGTTSRTFTRSGDAYFGKNGLQLSLQQS
jgi:Tfp pilus assembly protein PilV